LPAIYIDVVRAKTGRNNEDLKAARLIAALRDTLFPRLISGQLRLPEAEANSAG
jgi:type I restriction enzyme S subunit